MTLQEKLKTATNQLHTKLETLMYVNEIMQKKLSIEEYRQILTTNYKVHQVYEGEIFKHLPDEFSQKLINKARLKLPALTADVEQADIILPTILPSADSEIFTNPYRAIGAMYVLEGATLGGHVIYKKLKGNPNFDNSNLNFNYYQVYGDQLMNNWVSFVQAVNSLNDEHHDEVIKGANLMFNKIVEIAAA